MSKRLHIFIALLLLGSATIQAQNFWQSTGGPSAGSVATLVSHPDGSLFAGTGGGGVFKSTNNGATWLAWNGGIGSLNISSLTVTSAGTLVAGTGGGIFRLASGSATWVQTNLGGVQVSVVAARSNTELYAGVANLGIRKSINDGATWNMTTLDVSTPSSIAFGGAGGLVLVGTNIGMYQSTDAGSSWNPINIGLTSTNITTVSVTPVGDAFVGTDTAGVFKSTNNGATWVSSNSGVSSRTILSLFFNGLGHVFTGTLAGVFRSTDRGILWRPVSGGLSDPVVRSLVTNTNGVLFAGGGSGNGIVFRSVESTSGTFTVVQPNGGENWVVGTIQQIQWTSASINGKVRVELSRNGGASYSIVVDSTANTGVYPVTINGPATAQARIRVSSYADSILSDVSNAVFSISIPTLTVTTPNGGENWQIGTTQNIQWTSSNITGKVRIELSTNGGQTFSIITDSTDNTGVFPWSVSGSATAQARIRIASIASSGTLDTSDNNFTILAQPSIRITSPNGGESWQVGTTQNIRWTSINVSGAVKIEISRDGGLSFSLIIDSTNNTGVFSWTVTAPPTNQGRVRVSNIATVTVADTSDNDFAVTPPPRVTIQHPNGGDVLQIGSLDTIRWTSTGIAGNARIEISRDGGTTFVVIGSSIPDTGAFPWRVTGPRTAIARVRVEVTQAGLPPVSDTSDNNFAISVVSVVAPDTVISGASPAIIVRPPANYVATLARLFVRNGGRILYDSLDMTRTGTDFQIAIPPAYINIRGVEYYVLLSDGQVPITFPDSTPALLPAAIRVQVQNTFSTSAFQRRTYKMVSVPLELSDPSIARTFTDDYGPYNRSKWRVFKWEGTGYVEFPNIASAISPGNAFWLITHAGTSFDVDAGLSVNTRQLQAITVPPGWSQIANPFAFRVDWDSVVSGSLLSGPFYYDRGVFRPATVRVLQPWEGYFVYNSNTQALTIAFPPVEADSSLPLARDLPDEGSYGIRFSASATGSGLEGAENVIGFTANSRGPCIYPEPPLIADEYIRLSVVDDSQSQLVSLKQMPKEGMFWDMKLSTSLRNTEMVVQMIEHGQIPAGFEVFLLDKDNAALIPVQAGVFTLFVGSADRSLRVIIGTKEFAEEHSEDIPLVPLQFDLSQNYPNPFNPQTKIRYQLSKRSGVLLEIFNIVGQRVRTLVSREQTTGAYELVWDGANDAGQLVSSGVYIYRLRAEARAGRPGDHFTNTRKMILVR